MSASAMLTSIKNNLNLRSKRKRPVNRLGGFNAEKRTEYNLPKATTKKLNAIGKRLREERQMRMLKVMVLTVIIFAVLVSVLLFLTDGIIELLSY